MGCDIHIEVEVKQADGSWEHIINKWGRTHSWFNGVYEGRNYELFAILADVRNRFNVSPIAPTKGLPPDVSKGVKALTGGYCYDGHSYSYYTLKELLEYDWQQKVTLFGFVNASTFYSWWKWDKKWRRKPQTHCQGLGSGYTVISVKEMMRKLKKVEDEYPEDTPPEILEIVKRRKKLNKYYCQIKWVLKYSQTCSRFWDTTIPQLLALGNPEDVRIVFWFDN